MSDIVVSSKTHRWKPADNLSNTRLKDDKRGEVIIFKEASWQSLKIDVDALAAAAQTMPLHLVSSQAKVRIAIKKKLSG